MIKNIHMMKMTSQSKKIKQKMKIIKISKLKAN